MAVVRRLAACLALAAATTISLVPLSAADTGDWYVSLGVAAAPDIEEEGTGPSGRSTYTWEGVHDSVAPRLGVGYLACSGGANGGWALGVEGVITTCDVTPDSYQVDGLEFSNTSSNTLRYSTVGMTLYGGYQFGINPDNDTLSTFLLLTPFLGLGGAYADSELPDQGNSYEKGSGVGWYVEGGLRAGFFITERRWVVGAVADLTFSTGEVDIDYSQGRSSTVTHERAGVGAALVIGYRQ